MDSLTKHALVHLRRVYPRGTRIDSSNMNVLQFWRNGSHITSLNWQTYDKSMQINEAMFVGSNGWVLKPAKQLGLGETMTGRLRLVVELIGISSCE